MTSASALPQTLVCERSAPARKRTEPTTTWVTSGHRAGGRGRLLRRFLNANRQIGGESQAHPIVSPGGPVARGLASREDLPKLSSVGSWSSPLQRPQTRAWPANALFLGLFGGAVLTSLPIWWLHAIPVLTFASLKDHAAHFAALYAHALGGSAMLGAGGAALYLGWRGQRGWLHKGFDLYLLGGGAGAVAALALSALSAHPPYSLGVATGTLAVTWLVFAAMAWRAAWNRRFDSHREWTIRSYVVTWTFVGCRIAQMVPPFPRLGLEGVTAGIWLYWIAPVLLCEVALQWARGGPAASPRRQGGRSTAVRQTELDAQSDNGSPVVQLHIDG